jgi:hypothetical protein
MWLPKLIYFMHPYWNCRDYLAFKCGCKTWVLKETTKN